MSREWTPPHVNLMEVEDGLERYHYSDPSNGDGLDIEVSGDGYLRLHTRGDPMIDIDAVEWFVNRARRLREEA